MLIPRHGIGAAAIGERIFIPGGSRIEGFGVSDATTSYLPPLEDLPAFRRGDAFSDGELNLADPVRTLIQLFVDKEAVACLDAADFDDDGEVSVGDAIQMLNFLFLRGSSPMPPYPAAGGDISPDGLECRG